ncbi:hypothetical protein JP75_18435 [Devosia riboflavina]|uniref:ABC transporter ATP-binding protein n=1 Tax=Devosia riboflavina TaxID=46914 RepID=A0A087LZ23_9HYPH|nr:ABC transporter substrate-binding protein [Devosia riboflavina]KFL29876.1 hypothetical protein JP75_18435 [Devosia riboflavina]
MTLRLGRRQFVLGAATLATATALSRPVLAQQIELRMFWWGTERRSKMQQDINTLFEQGHPDIAVIGESAPFGDYWPRLATQVAGGNAPDVINMDYRYLAEYGGRDVLLPLDEFVGNGLDIADFGIGLGGGKMGDTLYAIPTGVNSSALMLNAAVYEEAGIEAPHPGMTWQQFGDNAQALTEKTTRDGMYGASDGSGREPVLEVWLRQRGKALYSADGALGYAAADIVDWFAYWQDLRERRAIPPADVVALDLDTFETGLVNTGQAALNYAFSSNLAGFQSLNQEPLTLVPLPVLETDPKPGQYLKPSMLFSIGAGSDKVAQSVEYLNFLLTTPEATAIMGLERGVPVSAKVRDAIAPQLNDLDRAMLDYISSLDGTVLGELPPLPPKGAGEAEKVLLRLGQEVGFGMSTPEAAAEQLVNEVTDLLSRA